MQALSPTSMDLWEQCPKRWYFERVLELSTDPGKEAACGSFVHLVLERLMSLPAEERTIERAKGLAAECWPAFANAEGFLDLELSSDDERQFKHNAWVGVLGYFQVEDPTKVEVMGTEMHVEADLDGVPVHGFVDRLDQGKTGVVVNDYKAGRVPEWDRERQEKLHQLRCYAAVLEASGTEVTELRLLYLSPQIAAKARFERLLAEEGAVLARFANLFPSLAPDETLDAIDRVEQARKAARKENSTARQAIEEAMWFAAEEALIGVDEFVDMKEAIPVLIAAAKARRRSYYAKRTAASARPCTISLRVTEQDLNWAYDRAAQVSAEVSQAFKTKEFPGRPHLLCDWCAFKTMCTEFQAWDMAGRPA